MQIGTAIVTGTLSGNGLVGVFTAIWVQRGFIVDHCRCTAIGRATDTNNPNKHSHSHTVMRMLGAATATHCHDDAETR